MRKHPFSIRVGMLSLALFGLDQATAPADLLVVDTFDQVEMAVALTGPVGQAVVIHGPIGEHRSLKLSSREAAVGTIMTGMVDTDEGALDVFVDGTSISTSHPLYIELHYSLGGPYSIAGYSAFVFEFSELQGTGALIIELGSQSLYGPETHRIPLNGSGDVIYAFEELNFGAGGSVGSFNGTHIRFEATSPQFSFTLDEIRLIPEPGSAVLFVLGTAGLAAMRRPGRKPQCRGPAR